MSRYAKILNQNVPSQVNENAKEQIIAHDLEVMKLKRLLDPREDLRRDSKLWVRVLYNAYHFNREVYGVLHGLRCGGAQLALTPASFRLLPGEWTVTEWEEIKQKWLDPIKEDLVNIFKVSRMGQVVDEEPPDEAFKQELPHTGKKLIFGVDTIDTIDF